MRVVVIGAGYVGGCTAAVMSKYIPDGHFTVVDISQPRIDAWNSPALPIYEPGLADIVATTRGVNLFFTTDVRQAVESTDIVFIAVNTPTKCYGRGIGRAYDLAAYESAAVSVAKYAVRDLVVVEKSTVPVRTAENMLRVMNANKRPGVTFSILSNPEFLAEGTAMQDLSCPDRVLIGGDDCTILRDLYLRWVPAERIITTNMWSSELSKLAANAMLSQRISSINSLSALCEKTGASVKEVARVLGADRRIGPDFLRAGIAFGGSCFGKDLLGLIYICESYHLHEVAAYWRAVLDINTYQKDRFCSAILSRSGDTLRGKRIAVLGATFKKDTSDIRESPAIDVIHFLVAEGALVQVYDPRAEPSLVADEVKSKTCTIHGSAYEAALSAAAVVIATEWDEFNVLDWAKIYAGMTRPALMFDGRGLMDSAAMRSIGFDIYSIGTA